MVDGSNKVDVDKLMSFSKDLVQFLKQDKDVSFLKQCIDQSNSLQSHCNTQYQALNTSIQVITDEINGLDHQRASIEEQRKLLKKLEQDQLRAEMKLSLYASVTSIIPDSDDQSKISGQANHVSSECQSLSSHDIKPFKHWTDDEISDFRYGLYRALLTPGHYTKPHLVEAPIIALLRELRHSSRNLQFMESADVHF
ncbi:hypothetical protein T459_12545 [Capsicum annuum]|uniref:Uncharacterized protein n=1 Tax=Capsicum annuum TaxID=4072 RepID=A0A2G2ZQ45_CAPAN|nr:hypothetical protein T459_12545 [Capsicum annuum]